MQTHSEGLGVRTAAHELWRGHDSTHHHLIRLNTPRNARCSLWTGSRVQGSARTGGTQCGGESRPDMAAGLWCGEGLEAPHGSSLSALFNMSEAMMEGTLAVQWLGLHILTAKGLGSFPGWGTKNPTSHTVCLERKRKTKP